MPNIKENTDKLLDFVSTKVQSGELDNNSLLELIKLAGMENPELEIQKLKAKLSIANHAYNEMALSQTVMSDSLKDANEEIAQLRADKARLIEALSKTDDIMMSYTNGEIATVKHNENQQLLTEMKEHKL